MSENSPHVVRFNPGAVAGALDNGEMQVVSSSTPEGHARLIEENVKKMFGDRFLGKEVIENALNIKLAQKDIPKIQFTEEELETGRKLGDWLVLRVSHTGAGLPITMEMLDMHMQPQFAQQRKGSILNSLFPKTDWYKRERFYTNEVLQARWAMVSNGTIYCTKRLNYVDQTERVIEYLKDAVFDEMELPIKYTRAIQEFVALRLELERINHGSGVKFPKDTIEVSKKFAELEINQLIRHSAVEFFYDALVIYQYAGEVSTIDRLSTWTRTALDHTIGPTDLNSGVVWLQDNRINALMMVNSSYYDRMLSTGMHLSRT